MNCSREINDFIAILSTKKTTKIMTQSDKCHALTFFNDLFQYETSLKCHFILSRIVNNRRKSFFSHFTHKRLKKKGKNLYNPKLEVILKKR